MQNGKKETQIENISFLNVKKKIRFVRCDPTFSLYDLYDLTIILYSNNFIKLLNIDRPILLLLININKTSIDRFEKKKIIIFKYYQNREDKNAKTKNKNDFLSAILKKKFNELFCKYFSS